MTFTYVRYVHDKLKQDNNIYVMLWAFWYHLLNLKNVKNTHGGVLLLPKVQAEAYNFTTNSSTTPSVFFTFF